MIINQVSDKIIDVLFVEPTVGEDQLMEVVIELSKLSVVLAQHFSVSPFSDIHKLRQNFMVELLFPWDRYL